MKIILETGHFENTQQMREFLTDVEILLEAFERLSNYVELDFIIQTTKLEVRKK